MNTQKLTQKSLEAIQAAQTLATENGNSTVEQCHLLSCLLQQEDGLIGQLISTMGVDAGSFGTAVSGAVGRLPKVQGGSREADKIYISNELDRALNAAEKTAAEMRDDYVSVEHLFLGLLKNPDDELKKLFATFRITEQRFLEALKGVRGSARCRAPRPKAPAGVAELVDALVLGTSIARCGGSSPFARTSFARPRANIYPLVIRDFLSP